MKTLSIDIETYSDVPLQKTGVYRYVESPNFEILLFAYSVDSQPVQVIDLACGEQIPKEVLLALEDETVIKWAFNASFERICLSRFLGYPTGEYLEPDSWRCSMIWAATMGLPLSLEGVGAVLGLEKQKLSEGKDLIKYFCQPCVPTKTNGQRTRNRPFHAPDKWAMFKKYNIRDVETEMGIQQRLAKFPVPAQVWDEYHMDQEINDRGVRLDMELVAAAIEMDTRSRTELTETMKGITELENPNSVQQMKAWLSDNGLETDTLGKKAVAELLKSAPPKLSQVLTLRQQLAKSSVRKYQAMEKTVCADGRARGMFQFYGANRTGRFSGRNIQLQNLPQNHLSDLAEARSLVRSGNFEAVELLYEDVPDTLSQLIRTAFIPREGTQFLVADFSAIEARVIAWFAGEKWRQDVFAKGGDIYCALPARCSRSLLRNIQRLLTWNFFWPRIDEQRETLTKLMAQGYIDQILYNQETNALLLQAETYRSDIEAITICMTGDSAKVTETNLLLHFVSHADMLTAYSDELFETYADHIEVASRHKIRFVMKCGLDIQKGLAGD